MNTLPMPRDGGSYRREPDGSLTCLQPTTADPGQPGISSELLEKLRLKAFGVEDVPEDGDIAAQPPTESAPRRRTSARTKE